MDAALLYLCSDGDPFTIEVGRAHTGYLGIFPGVLEAEQQRRFGLKSNEGFRVERVVPDGPAQNPD